MDGWIDRYRYTDIYKWPPSESSRTFACTRNTGGGRIDHIRAPAADSGRATLGVLGVLCTLHTHTHSVTHSLTHTLTHTHPELGVSHASGGAQVVEVADDGVRSAFGVLRVVRHAGLRVWYSLIYVCMYVCVYVCIYLYIYIHICRYMYVYICRYVCIHTYIHTFNTYMCIYNRAKQAHAPTGLGSRMSALGFRLESTCTIGSSCPMSSKSSFATVLMKTHLSMRLVWGLVSGAGPSVQNRRSPQR